MGMDPRDIKAFSSGLMHDTQEVFAEQLKWVMGVLNHHPEFRSILDKKDVSLEEKKKLLDDVLKDKIDAQVYNMVLMLGSSGRLHLLESVQQEFENMVKDREEHLTGSVRTAFPMSDEMMDRIESHFSAIVGSNLNLVFHVEPSLIGGMVVTIGDRGYDGSVRNYLHDMKEHILKD